MDLLLFYEIVFSLIFLFTLGSNLFFIFKMTEISKKFKSKLISSFLEKERNVASSLLVVKLAISGFMIILITSLIYFKELGVLAVDLDLVILLVGVVLVAFAGYRAVSKTKEMTTEYGFR